jgi:hypothetical protein
MLRTTGTTVAAGDRPVFLHGAWRSGSTFYWSRFRALPQTLCFYEPLHHGLAKLTHERIGRGGAGEVEALGHPVLEAPYFTEFARLIHRGRGVRNYRSNLAYERFNLDPVEPHQTLRRYVQTLVDHAKGQNRTPVLGFNRSGGRVAWLKARFGAYDIHIDREPAAVWGSYASELAEGNATFFSMWLRILEANRNHPVWAPLAERLQARGPLSRRVTRIRTAHRAQIDAMDKADTYLLVFYAWLATAPASMAACDLVIDDALIDQPHYARRLEHEVEARTNLRLDLSGAQVRKSRALLDPMLQRRVEAEALSLFPRGAYALNRTPATERMLHLCSRKAELVSALA